MPSSDHPNVVATMSAFARLAAGDTGGFSPDYTHIGFNIDGTPQIFTGLPAFLDLMAKAGASFEVYGNDVRSADAVGDELVTLGIGCHRRTHDGREYRGTFAMILRVEDGLLTRGSDMIESAGETYWRSLDL